MGVGLNSMAALLGTAAVSASKVGTAMEGAGKDTLSKNQISESNNADKSAMAAQKAKLNMEKMKTLKLQLKQQKLKNKELRAKNKEARAKAGGKSNGKE